MPVMSYTARTLTGDLVTGTLPVKDERALRMTLSQRGMEVVEFDTESGGRAALSEAPNFAIPLLKPVRGSELRWFTGQAALMLETGSTVSETFDALGAQTPNKKFADVLNAIQESVLGGSSLSKSLAAHPRVFSDFYVSAVKAGENTGELAEAFCRLESHLAKRHALVSRVRTALVYPTILMSLGVFAVVVMMTYVVPKFVTIFNNFDAELPAPTQVLMTVASFTGTFWYLIPPILASPFVTYWLVTRYSAGRAFVDRAALHLPVIGPLTVQLQSSTLLRTLGMLLNTGVTLVESMEVAEESCSNSAYKETIQQITKGILQGESFAVNFSKSDLFSPSVKQMVATGDKTGALSTVMTKLADHLDDEIDTRVTRLSAWLEPLIIILMGAAIGGMAVALLAPLFQLSSAVRGG